jgi:phosphopantothenoylcysteine decarboxylase/phosphopantothenate--cysteine ligase
MNPCSGKHILVGVTGSIAAYKSCYLVRLLVKSGASVQVVMTQSATKFVGKQTFESLSGQPAHCEMFPEARAYVPWHVELSRWADAFVIAPATANIIGKIANGIADDLLSATAMSYNGFRVIAPAMNPRMYENPILQRNLKILSDSDWQILEPGVGLMAHPDELEGKGRMAEPEDIFSQIESLWQEKDFQGVRILVTAGRTEEPWDPVRILTNPATGRMGFAVAEAAQSRGAEVTVIAGPHEIPEPKACRVISVRTSKEMAEAVRKKIKTTDVLMMTAAVSDFRPKNPSTQKLKKQKATTILELEPTEDILASLPPASKNQIRVGFAVETSNLVKEATRKLKEKHLDIIVANNPTEPGAGFGYDTNRTVIITKTGLTEKRPLESKKQLASHLLDMIAKYRSNLKSSVGK